MHFRASWFSNLRRSWCIHTVQCTRHATLCIYSLVAQPEVHRYEAISKQAFGIGSSVINTGTSRSSASVQSSLGSEAPVSECVPGPTPRFGSVVSPSVAWTRRWSVVAYLGYWFCQVARHKPSQMSPPMFYTFDKQTFLRMRWCQHQGRLRPPRREDQSALWKPSTRSSLNVHRSVNEVLSQQVMAWNCNNTLDELRGRFAETSSKGMYFGFFEVPAHVHTFDESLTQCTRRSNSTPVSRAETTTLSICPTSWRTNLVSASLWLDLKTAENILFVWATARYYHVVSVGACTISANRALCCLLVPEMLATSSATEPLFLQ